MNSLLRLPESEGEVTPFNAIRAAGVLLRFPVHNLTKREDVNIEIREKSEEGEFLWMVSYNERYGQARQLAYKLDTLVINRRIDETGYPVPEVLKLGSLREIASEVGMGGDTSLIKAAFYQNAFTGITAKLRYKTRDKRSQNFEFATTRYGVVFAGETLPDGTEADAVYLVFNPLYRDLLNQAETRPLDYDYLKALGSPTAQRFYELVSPQIWAAIEHKRPRARFLYSEFCAQAPQTRYVQYKRMNRQMKEVHAAHLESGYLADVELRETTDRDGRIDWELLYEPGPKAISEHKASKRKARGGSGAAELEEPVKRGRGRPRKTEALPAVPVQAEPKPAPERSAAPLSELPLELHESYTLLLAQGFDEAAARALCVDEFSGAQEKPVASPEERARRIKRQVANIDRRSVKRNRLGMLRRAIREDWGEPGARENSERERSRATRVVRAPLAETTPQNASQSLQDARRATKEAEDRERYLQALHAPTDDFRGFLAFARSERVKAEAICAHLKPERREAHLSEFDGEEKQASLYARWLVLTAEERSRWSALSTPASESPLPEASPASATVSITEAAPEAVVVAASEPSPVASPPEQAPAEKPKKQSLLTTLFQRFGLKR